MNASTPDDHIADQYPNDEPVSGSSAPLSAFLPLTLLSISLALVLFWQVRTTSKQADLLTQTIEQNKGGVLEAQQIQGGITKLVADLYEVAKEDNDAKLILYYYDVRDPKTGQPLVKISNPGPAGSAVGTAPAAAPTASGTK